MEAVSSVETPVPIVMFHEIAWPRLRSRARGMGVPPPLLRSYIRTMDRQGWRGLSMGEVAARWAEGRPMPAKTIVFTFDDAYAGVHRHALPALEARGWTATVYAVSGQIGGRNAWMEGQDGQRPLMTREQLQDAAARGFEIGAHTRSHASLTRLAPDAAWREILDSKKTLEDTIGKEVASFAYPYGDHDATVKRLVQESGFRSAVSVLPGQATSSSDRFALPRVAVVSWRLSPKGLMRLIETAPVG